MLIPDDLIEVCGKVFAGEYDINYSKPNPVILDIGANIGAFTRWAKYRWPDSTIYAYEPSPDCMHYLMKNVQDLKYVFVNHCAVGQRSGTQMLYRGLNNSAMSSLKKTEYTQNDSVEVSVKSASSLPVADIVKCDTEGSEVEILRGLQFDPHVLLIEYHTLRDRKIIEEMYSEKYTLFEFKLGNLRTGNLKFIRNDIIKVV